VREAGVGIVPVGRPPSPRAFGSSTVLPATDASGRAPRAAPDGGELGPRLTEVFYDFFERAEVGPDYLLTTPNYRVQGGRLCVSGAHNHPAWLRRALPVNARIEYDATSASPDGDIKAESWGDGMSQARGVSYGDATSYLAILGGWKNTKHLLARLDEHAPGQPTVLVDPSGRNLKARPVAAGHAYHFKVERSDGRTVVWLVDDIELVTLTDPNPLKGPGHRYFAFNDWEVPICFDNLKITPLPGE